MLKKYLVKSDSQKMVIYWTGDISSLKSYASKKWACAQASILTIKELSA